MIFFIKFGKFNRHLYLLIPYTFIGYFLMSCIELTSLLSLWKQVAGSVLLHVNAARRVPPGAAVLRETNADSGKESLTFLHFTS